MHPTNFNSGRTHLIDYHDPEDRDIKREKVVKTQAEMASNVQAIGTISGDNQNYLKHKVNPIKQSDLMERLEAIENPAPLVLSNYTLKLKDKLVNPYNHRR